jgi:septal ring factor EnvC (AmiA/AmiB activator)
MIYLIAQIALFLLLAVLSGVLVGWWFWGRKQCIEQPDNSEEIIEGKRRLDQCHNKNAKLSRDLKQCRDDLDKLSHQIEVGDKAELLCQLEDANAQIQALMEDVQMRDDMIIVLQKHAKG